MAPTTPLQLFTRVSGYHLTERATAHPVKFIASPAQVQGNPHKSHVIESCMNMRACSAAILLVVMLCLSLYG
jgi:hypothetical protein